MSVKIALLKSNESVIADIKELISDDKVCGYLFEHPHVVDVRVPLLTEVENDEDIRGKVEVALTPWIILTEETKVPVAKDWIVSIVEPIKTIKEMYEEKVNEQASEVPSSEG